MSRRSSCSMRRWALLVLLLAPIAPGIAQNATQMPADLGDMSKNLDVPLPLAATPGAAALNEHDRKFVSRAAQLNEMLLLSASSVSAGGAPRSDLQRAASGWLHEDRALAAHLAAAAHAAGLALPTERPSQASARTTDAELLASRLAAQRNLADLLERECRSGRHPALKSFARRSLPRVQHSIETLESLQRE